MAPYTGVASAAALPEDEAMASASQRQVVTGNRLRDGAPVYFAGGGRWSTRIDDALSVPADAGEGLLAEAQSSRPPVVAPYLIEAAAAGGRLRPASLRERIRAFGPTVSYR